MALTVADLAFEPAGLRVTITRSKGDQEGEGQQVAIPHGTNLLPVEAVGKWLVAAGITSGLVFRRIGRSGKSGENGTPGALATLGEALTPDSVADLVKHYAAKVPGLDASVVSAHSLRRGFLTSGAAAGATLFKLMEVSRHKRVETLRVYVDDAQRFKDHAGGTFL